MENHIEQEVGEINKKVTSILTLLRGNELDKTDTGMAGSVEDLERRVKDLEKFKAKAINIAIGAGFPFTWGLFDMVYKLFFKK